MDWLRIIKACRVVGAVVLLSVSVASQAEQNVLAIHSYHSEYTWTASVKQGIDEELGQNKNIRVFHEYLDSKRYPEIEFQQKFIAYLADKFDDTPLDAIIVTDDPALEFLQAHHDDYFHQVPVVFLGINHPTQELLNTPWLTGVFESRDLGDIVLEIKRQTQLDDLIIVNDSTSTGQANLARTKPYFANQAAPQRIYILNNLDSEGVLQAFQAHSEKTPVFLLGQLVNPLEHGALLSWEQSVDILRSNVKNPIYTFAAVTLGQGVVGGKFLEGRHHGRQAAGLALRIVQGVPVQSIKPIEKAANRWIFDAQEMKRHRLNLNSLPVDSELINQEESFYHKYKLMVWIVIASFLVAVVVILMLVEIIRRGSMTKKILQENECRYRDLAQAGANIFWEIDTELKFSYVSGDTMALYGMSAPSLIGRMPHDLLKRNSVMNFPWDDYELALSLRKPLVNLSFSVKQRDKEVKVFMINGKPIYDAAGLFVGYRGINKEITEEHQLSETIAYQASYDSLTGLINRREFNRRLKLFVARPSFQTRSSYLCFLDLDHFKLVNDTAGHLVGDAMLAELTQVLQSCLREQDTLGRLGGDEFGLLLINMSQQGAQALCHQMIRKVEAYSFKWDERYFKVGISIGMIQVDTTLTEVELLSKADLSCYKAKDLGRGRLYVADLHSTDFRQDQLQLGYIANVSQSLEQGRFYLVKQAIKSLDPKRQAYEHFEILLRYKDEQGQIISPALFIPAAEKHGVITLIDRWVLETTLRRYEEFFPNQDTMLSINLSGMTLSNDESVSYIASLVKHSRVPPANICFEITETAAISQLNQALEFIANMKALGIKFALDDFGSGASSFGYLKKLPVDYLKIDGSLVKNIVSEPSDRAIVASVNSIAHLMGMETIAEFVENDEIKAILEEIGVDYVQGYGIGKPENCADNED